MKKTQKLIEALAKDYVVRYTGIGTRYMNMALSGDRSSPLAETAVKVFRVKCKELEQQVKVSKQVVS